MLKVLLEFTMQLQFQLIFYVPNCVMKVIVCFAGHLFILTNISGQNLRSFKCDENC